MSGYSPEARGISARTSAHSGTACPRSFSSPGSSPTIEASNPVVGGSHGGGFTFYGLLWINMRINLWITLINLL